MSTESDFWTKTRKEMSAETDLSVFKTWPTVRMIPIYKDNEFPMTYPHEVEYMLRRRPSAEISRWKSILREPFLGHTDESYKRAALRFFDGTASTSWALKSAHHILIFEGMSGKSITDYEQIVEFGAGIGETARLILDSGFEGKYTILDLPETGRTSDYYLNGRAKVVSDLSDIIPSNNTLFIATWSLSEVPEDYKDEVVKYFKGCDFLIIFQNDIFGYDNYNYFTKKFPILSETKMKVRPIPWHKGAGGNFYLYASSNEISSSTDGPSRERMRHYALPPVKRHSLRVMTHFVRRLPLAVWRRLRKRMAPA